MTARVARGARARRAAILVRVIGVLLPACAGPPATPRAARREPSAFRVQHLDAGRRIVTGAGGETLLVGQPRRVAALSYADEVLALGVTPCAFGANWGAARPYAASALRGARRIDALLGSEPPLEEVAEVRPDLILTNGSLRRPWALSRIAPTVVLRGGDDVEGRLREVAEVLGVPDRAQPVIDDYRARVAEARRILGERLRGQSVALLRVRARRLQILGDPEHHGDLLYRELGLTPPALVRDRALMWRTLLDPELLRSFDVDHLFVAINPTLMSEGFAASLEGMSGWEAVPAVRRGNVYYVAFQNWNGPGLVSREVMIDELVSAVERAGRFADRTDDAEGRRAALRALFDHPGPTLRAPLPGSLADRDPD